MLPQTVRVERKETARRSGGLACVLHVTDPPRMFGARNPGIGPSLERGSIRSLGGFDFRERRAATRLSREFAIALLLGLRRGSCDGPIHPSNANFSRPSRREGLLPGL